MKFVFNGTLDELKHTIHTKAQELNKDIVIYHSKSNTLEIGFQRLGHSGGRFLIATVHETANSVVINGEIADIYSGRQQTKLQAFLSLLGGFTIFYVLVELVLQIVWLPIFHFAHIWIPLLLPLPLLAFLRIHVIKQEKKADTEFVSFLSAFTAGYCPYLNEYIDEGCCYDLQMILDGYMKDSALPERKVDKPQLSKHCSKCRCPVKAGVVKRSCMRSWPPPSKREKRGGAIRRRAMINKEGKQ